ncbi:hypothetical protein Nmel_016043 [Mimus melanotis]
MTAQKPAARSLGRRMMRKKGITRWRRTRRKSWKRTANQRRKELGIPGIPSRAGAAPGACPAASWSSWHREGRTCCRTCSFLMRTEPPSTQRCCQGQRQWDSPRCPQHPLAGTAWTLELSLDLRNSTWTLKLSLDLPTQPGP